MGHRRREKIQILQASRYDQLLLTFDVTIRAFYTASKTRGTPEGEKVVAEPGDIKQRLKDWVEKGTRRARLSEADTGFTLDVLYVGLEALIPARARTKAEKKFAEDLAAARLPEPDSTAVETKPSNGSPPFTREGGPARADQLSIATVAGAAASGLGVLGFVTFAGGVVLWRRFSEMGLPGDQAVSLVPSSLLVSTGADFLVPALGIAAAMVLLLTFFRIVAGTNQTTIVMATIAGAVFALVDIAFAAIARDQIHALAFGVLLVIAVASGVAVGVSFHRLRSAATIALVAFFAAGTFWLARGYEKTSHAPTAIPMAYSRAQSGEPAIVGFGFLVAETSDRIWFASLAQSRANELREVPRSEIDNLEVGQVTNLDKADARARLFAGNLCTRLEQIHSRTVSRHAARRRVPDNAPIGCPPPKNPAAQGSHQ